MPKYSIAESKDSMRAERHLARLPRANLFQDALAAIEQYVEELPPGSRVRSERELAASLDVSRPLIRQAIKVLEGLGRVESRPGSGTFVRDPAEAEARGYLLQGLRPDEATLKQVVSARRAVEAAVIDALLGVWDESMSAELMETIRRAPTSVSGGDVRANLEFEVLLGKFCGNEVLSRLQALTHSAWLEAHRGSLGEASSSESARREHLLILEALSKGNGEEARDLMSEHIEGVGSREVDAHSHLRSSS